MQKFKRHKDNSITLGDTKYKGYLIGNLPPSFGFKYKEDAAGNISEGVYQWFNYKGLTYIEDNESR